jgi:hypothetical protein
MSIPKRRWTAAATSGTYGRELGNVTNQFTLWGNENCVYSSSIPGKGNKMPKEVS